jgi:glucokinase
MSRSFTPRSQAQAPFYVGIDLGGTNIKIGVVDDLGRPLAWHSIPTDPQLGAANAAERMGHGVRGAIAKAGLQPGEALRIGLATPGTMDIPAGLLLNPPNLPGWVNFPIRDEVSRHAGLPVTFANDAAAAAFGEFWVGTGREYKSMVLFTLGTGVGCGIIIDDFSIDGEHSHGAECGHIIIDCNDTARLCSCGQRGHLEAYASATAVVKRTREALEIGATGGVAERAAAGETVSTLLLAEEAERGDALANHIILETARYLGIGIVSTMHTIDPSGVLIGGAMTFGEHETSIGRRFLERVREEVRTRALPVPATHTTIDYASLGGDAGYIGAAGLARVDQRKGASFGH